MKHRKKNPAKMEARKALKEWREAALVRANHQCEWCGSRARKITTLNKKTGVSKSHLLGLNVHHIIGKRYAPLRYSKVNSIVLCARCHKFGIGISAHENPIRVVVWLHKVRPIALRVLFDATNDAIKNDTRRVI